MCAACVVAWRMICTERQTASAGSAPPDHHSLGGVESTIERRAAIPGQTHLPPELLRLSVGCEHPDDLWRDLQQALMP
jgi:hypothetical protein